MTPPATARLSAAALAATAALAALTVLAPARNAAAQACPAIAGGGDDLAAVDVGDRAQFLDAALTREARRGRIWSLAWGWSLTAVTAGQATIAALTDDPDDRAVWIVSAGKSSLGVIWSFTFDRPDVSVPRTATDCAQLAAAETALITAARDERIGWLPHAESVALNAAAVLYLGLVHDRFAKGLGGAASAIAVAELRLYTRPKGAIRALRDYRAGRVPASGAATTDTAWDPRRSPLLAPSRATSRAEWLVVPRADPDLVGLAVIGTF